VKTLKKSNGNLRLIAALWPTAILYDGKNFETYHTGLCLSTARSKLDVQSMISKWGYVRVWPMLVVPSREYLTPGVLRASIPTKRHLN
jgi:hypothetical protein